MARPGNWLFAAAFLGVVAWFKVVDVWSDHFDEPSLLYPVDAIMKVVFLVYFSLILATLGRGVVVLVVGNVEIFGLGRLERFLLNSFIGASVVTIVMFAVGLAGLLHDLPIILVTLPLVFMSYGGVVRAVRGVARGSAEFFLKTRKVFSRVESGNGGFRQTAASILITALALLAAGEMVHLLLGGGLVPDIKTNDTVGHYVPYFRDTIEKGNLFPDKHLYDFFALKGVGLHFFSAVLTNIQTIQISTLYFLLLSSLVLFSFVQKVSRQEIAWPLLAVVIFLSANGAVGILDINILDKRGVLLEFHKSHLTIGALIAWFAYMSATYLSLSRDAATKWFILHALVGAAATIYSTQSAAFSVSFLMVLAVGFVLLRHRDAASRLLKAAGVIVAVAVVIMVINYSFLGILEINPHSVFNFAVNESLLRRWIDPFALWLHFRTNPESIFDLERVLEPLKGLYFWIKDRPIADPLFAVAVLSFLFFFKWIVSMALQRKYDREAVSAVLCVCAVLVIGAVIQVLVSHSSVSRFFGFLILFETAVVVIIVQAIAGLVRFGASSRLVYAAIALFLGANAVVNSPVYAKPGFGLAEEAALITGNKSFSAYYGKTWKHDLCREAQRSVGFGTRIMLLNFLPACYGMPGSGFQRPLMNDFNRELSAVILGDGLTGKGVLRKYGVDYAFVDLSFPVFRFVPAFSPKAVAANMTVVWRKDSAYLMKWRNTGDPPPAVTFIEAYTDAFESSRSYRLNRSMDSAIAAASD